MEAKNKCKICGLSLSRYNTTGQCFKHSVSKKMEEEKVNEDAIKTFTSGNQPLLHEERW